MSVHRCLWHGAQLRLECRDTICIHCQLGQRVTLWDGSYKEALHSSVTPLYSVLLSVTPYGLFAAYSAVCN